MMSKPHQEVNPNICQCIQLITYGPSIDEISLSSYADVLKAFHELNMLKKIPVWKKLDCSFFFDIIDDLFIICLLIYY